MKGLTKRQSELLQFIQEFIALKHYSPSYREIQTHFGFSSLGTVYSHIKILKHKGLLNAKKQSRRSITPTEAPPSLQGLVILPLAGQVRCGHPIELYSEVRELAVPASMIAHPDRTYLLQVKGDGFNDELTADGDLIVLEVTKGVINNRTMLIEINKNETLMKKTYDEGDFVRLESKTFQNPSLVLRKEDLLIHGQVLAIVRLF